MSGTIGPRTDRPMLMQWQVTAGDTITLYGQETGTPTYDYDVDWGDGTSETSVTINDKTHTYSSTGTYLVRIYGTFAGLKMWRSPSDNQNKLVKFIQWGSVAIQGVFRCFAGCDNLLYEATDGPNISGGLPASAACNEVFRDCGSITSVDLSNWKDTEQFTALYRIVYRCDNVETINISNWKVNVNFPNNVIVENGASTPAADRDWETVLYLSS